jgi:oxygen-dependent protoporphyrinogen oxidase
LSPTPRRAVVLGGGITGLVAAHRLAKGAGERGIPLEILLLEASGGFGGSIETARESGFVMEKGPDCFLSTKPEGIALCRELGLEDRLTGTKAEHRRSFILRNNRLVPVPEGFYLLAPSSILPFLTTPIFSPLGKLRMGMDLVIPRRREEGDETLASFVRRRFGREALERMAQPMIAGIYSADPEELSLEATMPQFLEMERESGSVIRALRKRMKKIAKERQSASASGPRYGLFLTLEEGMGTLIDALLERIPAESLRPNARASSLSREGERWRIGIEGAETIEADAVCLALPAGPAGELLEGPAPSLRAHLDGIGYGSVATLNLAFGRDQVAHPLDGMGFVVPAIEGRSLLACSFSSSKFENRAPEGKVLLRAFVGGPHGSAALGLSDDDLIARVMDELRPLLGLRGEPEATVLAKYRGAMAQYRLGHLERIRAIEEGIATLPGIAAAGSAYRGVGIPDCAAGAGEAAARLLDHIAQIGA